MSRDEFIDENLQDLVYALEKWCMVKVLNKRGQNMLEKIEHIFNHHANPHVQIIEKCVREEDQEMLKLIVKNEKMVRMEN